MLNHRLLDNIEETNICIDLSNNKDILFDRTSFNIYLLFNSFNDSMDIISIINKLISVYDYYNDTFKDEVKLLKKYKDLYLINKKVLSKLQLKEYFNIDLDYIIDNDIVIDNVNKYVNYMRARNNLIKYNIRLVNNLALKYSKMVAIEYEELFEEGLVGLIKAVDNFDYELGNKFSTYATVVVRSYILKYITNNLSSLSTTSRYYSKMKMAMKRIQELEIEEGRKLSTEEIAKILSISEDIVKEYVSFPNNLLYLDESCDFDSDLTFKEQLCSETDVESILKSISDKEMVEKFFNCLTDKEKQIIELLYGFNDEDEVYSSTYVAKKLKMQLREVMNIHKFALLKIRRFFNKDDDYLDYKKNGLDMNTEWKNENGLFRIRK